MKHNYLRSNIRSADIQLLVILLLLGGSCVTVSAQDSSRVEVRRDSISGVNRFLGRLGQDGLNTAETVGRTYLQPAHWKKRDFMLLGGALAISGAALLVDEPIYRFVQNNRTSFFDKLEDVGDAIGRPNVVYPFMFTVWGSGVIANNDWLRDTGLMVIASVTTSGLIQTASKTVVGRSRPGAGLGAFSFKPFGGPDYHSFPSGHAIFAISTAWIMARRIDNKPLKIVFFAIPVIVGGSRVYEGAHWLSDVLLGSALGIACAESVLRFYPLIKAKRQERRNYRVNVLPGLSGATVLVTF